MTPIAIGKVLGWLTSLIGAAPQIAAVYTQAKDFVKLLFEAKLISVEQQNLLWAHIDSIKALYDAGIVPSSWTVQPDPE